MKKILLLSIVLCLVGCMKAIDEQGNETTVLDPNSVAKIEAGAEAGALISQLLAPLVGPTALIVSGALASALGVWRKMKPAILNAKSEAEIAYATSSTLVDSIAQYKKENPKDWDKLAPLIEKAIASSGVDPKIIENMIRGLRGLPPKG